MNFIRLPDVRRSRALANQEPRAGPRSGMGNRAGIYRHHGGNRRGQIDHHRRAATVARRRTDKSLIRTGADSCTVEAVFSGDELMKLNARLEEAGVEPCEDELILKRTFLRNRRRIGNSSTARHDTRGPEKSRRRTGRSARTARSPIVVFTGTQLRLLDGFARAENARASIENIIGSCRNTRGTSSLSTAETAREQELDLLRHQVNEITCGESERDGRRRDLFALPTEPATANG